MKYLCYTLGDPTEAEAAPPPPPELYQKMDALIEEATKAGVMLATGGVSPVKEAVRVSYNDGEFTVRDGPFAEAKELVGGWALIECRDKDEAVEWAKRFLSLVGSGESTVRPVYGP